MGICSTAIADQESAPMPNAARVLWPDADRYRLTEAEHQATFNKS
jgi:hypothetical protein